MITIFSPSSLESTDGTGKDRSGRVKGHYDLATAIIHTGKEFQTGDRVKGHTIVARRTIINTGKEFRTRVQGHYDPATLAEQLSIQVRNSEVMR